MSEIPIIKSSPKKSNYKSNKPVLKIFIFLFLIILFGIGLGYYYNQLPENNPQRDQSSCEQTGGKWLANKAACLISNRKTGEDCIDGGQCQSGVCFPPNLNTKQQQNLNNGEIITNITGTCYPENLIKGCIKQVKNGQLSSASMCN